MPWYNNRKPYYQLGKSLTAFFREPIRYLKTSSSIESALEKPYLQSDYPDLHFGWNLPTWQWNWPGFGGGHYRTCFQSDYEYCQTQAFVTVNPEIHNVALAGGWGNMDYGASLTCGVNSLGCALKGDEAAPVYVGGVGGYSAPKGWVKHESSDTCTEDFDVDYMFIWSEYDICGGGSIPRFCKGTFKVFCDRCALAGPLAWDTIPVTVVQGQQDVEIIVAGGAANYTWGVNGDAHFDELITAGTTNYLDVDAAGCGVLAIHVGNSCGDSLDFVIRISDAGIWCRDPNDHECHGASGLGTYQTGAIYHWTGGDENVRIVEFYRAYSPGGGYHCDDINCGDACDNYNDYSCSSGACGNAPNASYGCTRCLEWNWINKWFWFAGGNTPCNGGDGGVNAASSCKQLPWIGSGCSMQCAGITLRFTCNWVCTGADCADENEGVCY